MFLPLKESLAAGARGSREDARLITYNLATRSLLHLDHGFVATTEAYAKLRSIRKSSDWRKGKEQNWQPYEEHGQLPHQKRMNVPLCALSLSLEINA